MKIHDFENRVTKSLERVITQLFSKFHFLTEGDFWKFQFFIRFRIWNLRSSLEIKKRKSCLQTMKRLFATSDSFNDSTRT
jgi:hypothetical protein